MSESTVTDRMDLSTGPRSACGMGDGEAKPAPGDVVDGVLDAVPMLIAHLDPAFNFVRVNRAFAAARGMLPGDFAGRNYFELCPNAGQQDLFRRVRDTGRAHSARAMPFAQGGTPGCQAGHWDWMLTPLKDAQGAVQGLLLTLQDVTARVQAIEALAESRNTLQSIIDTIPIRVYWKDRESRYLGCNSAFARDVGMAGPEEVIGRNDRQLAWREHADRSVHEDRALMESGAARLAVDEPATMPDGRPVWLRSSRVPLRNAAGEIIGVLGIYDDITEYKRVERQLQLTQTAIDKSRSAFFWISPEGRVLYVNDHACSSLGCTREELVGQYVWSFDPDFPPDAWPAFWEEFRQKGMLEFETRHRRKDGTVFPVLITCSHIVYEGEEQGGFTFVQDISERKRAERELQLTHVAINKSQTCFYWLSPKGQVIYVNDHACRSLGYTREELVGLYIWDFDPDFPPEAQAPAWEETKKRGTKTMQSRHRRKDGTIFPIELTANYIAFNGEEHSFVFVQDITERRRAEQELQIAATAFETQEGMIVTDADGVILRVNRAFTELTGYSAQDAVGRTPAILKSGRQDAAFYGKIWETLVRDGNWQGEIWNRRKNGETYPQWLSITAVRNEARQVTHYVGHFNDISERKAAEEKIRNLAFFDPLTQLPNRRLLMDRLEHALAASARNLTYGAVLFIDLDDFKGLNDTRGHETGDLLLLEVAARLAMTVRERDTVARLGGDEFVVMLEELHADREQAASMATTVANKILAAMHRPCVLRGYEHATSCSIGVSLFLGHQDPIEDLLARADTAMYEAKKAGRNTLRFFDPAMQEALEARTRLESWMRQALPQRQFRLHYQLQMGADGQALGAEALIRWEHPQQGLISPAAFIPVAEETGLILAVGQWVIDTACAQIRTWEGHPLAGSLAVSVNVSARQFRQPDFVEQVEAAVARHAIDPRKLKLELTESSVIHNVDDAIGKMRRLKEFGVSFSMDDFGTGHSSLSYLRRLPLDQIKVDQSFVRDIAADAGDAAIVQTIISMGRTLGLQVIAEGVETEAQLALLRAYGCQAFQGYLFGRPAAAAELERALEALAREGGRAPTRVA